MSAPQPAGSRERRGHQPPHTYRMLTVEHIYVVRRWLDPVYGHQRVNVRCTHLDTGIVAEATHTSQRVARAQAHERCEEIRQEERL